ncbi:MAG: hypothetical protein CMO77_08940, partial [Verrucomicrobiales bacterium]|nr:hypothetical protein [Verrucomicrobiales bacterium]
EREESDDDLIGVDEDEDGYDAYDEKLTGHSDNDPDDKPTDEELDAAYNALEEEGLDPMELPPPPVEMAEPSISTSVSEMEDEAQNGVDAYYEVVTQAKDELGLRKITENRIANANRVRSYFESVAVGPVAQWQRQNITGLFNEATDPRLGFSAIKWMEMLNFNLKVNDFSIANPKDEAFQRLRFRNSSELGSEGGPLIHEFIKTDSEYELAFLLSQNLNIDQQDSRGRTALHIAAANGQLATVKQLLFGGANHEIADDYGFSALHWAAQNGQLEVVHYLVEKVKVKSGKDRFNRDPAALAKANGHTIVSDYLQSKN